MIEARPRWQKTLAAVSGRSFPISLACIVLLALALRISGIDRRSIWFDEGITIDIARRPIGGVIDAARGDLHPPLYYLLMHFWLFAGRGETWIRLLSVVFGVATVFLTGLAGRALFASQTGLLAAFLVAISPFMIDMSQETRDYTLLCALAVASIVSMHFALTSSHKWWFGYAAIAAMMIYTHNYAWFLFTGEGLYLLGIMAQRRQIEWRGITSMLLAITVWLPWLPGLAAQVSTVGSGSLWVKPITRTVLTDSFFSLAFYTQPGWDQSRIILLSAGALIIVGALVLATLSIPQSPQVLLPGLATATPVLLSFAISVLITPIFVPRYLAYVVPPFWLLTAQGLARFPTRARILLTLVVVAAVAFNLSLLYGGEMDDRADIRSAAGVVQAEWKPGDLVVNSSLFGDVPFNYYAQDPVELAPEPIQDRSDLQAAVAQHPRFWYVSNFARFDPDDEKDTLDETLKLLAGWPILEQRRFEGVHLFLLEGRKEP